MAAKVECGVPTIAEFYSGKNIFLTGGTGFIGKVFIEKVLRSCTDVGDIYILIRPRRGKSVRDRMRKIFTEKVSQIPCMYPIATWSDLGIDPLPL